MKQFFKLSEHKNDKNTAFAGSLHSAAWLGALALLQSQSSTDALVQARQGIMRSDIWFRQPVRSDFEVLSESVQQTSASAAWHINNVVQDEEGVKCKRWHLLPKLKIKHNKN